MIAIISATKEEIGITLKEVVSKKIYNKDNIEITEGIILNERFVFLISGVGIRKAKNAANLAITMFKPRIILSVGFAGALNRGLNVGDVVLGDKVLSIKENHSINLFNKIPYVPFNIKNGTVLSENRFINNRKEKEQIYQSSGALCVDMETYGVAEIAEQKKTVVMSIRVISDNLDYSLPRMEKLFNKKSNLKFSSCLKYLIQNPEHIIPFTKFKLFNLRKAKIKLNHFLKIFIPIIIETKN